MERLLGYQAVGADVLYAPGLPDLTAITKLCNAVDKPVNVVRGIGLERCDTPAVARGRRERISAGSALARVAFGAMVTAMNKIYQNGDFDDFDSAGFFWCFG